jgi:hypothetical protein
VKEPPPRNRTLGAASTVHKLIAIAHSKPVGSCLNDIIRNTSRNPSPRLYRIIQSTTSVITNGLPEKTPVYLILSPSFALREGFDQEFLPIPFLVVIFFSQCIYSEFQCQRPGG